MHLYADRFGVADLQNVKLSTLGKALSLILREAEVDLQRASETIPGSLFL